MIVITVTSFISVCKPKLPSEAVVALVMHSEVHLIACISDDSRSTQITRAQVSLFGDRSASWGHAVEYQPKGCMKQNDFSILPTTTALSRFSSPIVEIYVYIIS